MDNLNTYRPGALYETFEPAEAKALWDRFQFAYTLKHGSWLNVAKSTGNSRPTKHVSSSKASVRRLMCDTSQGRI